MTAMSGKEAYQGLAPRVPEDWGSSLALRIGNAVHVAGVFGINPATGILASTVNMSLQLRQAYRNLEDALARLGAGLDDVVSETAYVTDLAAARLYGIHEIYKAAPRPVRSIVEVRSLRVDSAMIELSCIALK